MTPHALADQLQSHADQIQAQAEAAARHLEEQAKLLAATLESVEKASESLLDHVRAIMLERINALDKLAQQIRTGAPILPPASQPTFTANADELTRDATSTEPDGDAGSQ